MRRLVTVPVFGTSMACGQLPCVEFVATLVTEEDSSASSLIPQYHKEQEIRFPQANQVSCCGVGIRNACAPVLLLSLEKGV